ncbi:MAG: TonB-dependent receptor [Xanthomonadales bacterium]|nr:TonB-dependent receptor [Xanthomonadales bacterium]
MNIKKNALAVLLLAGLSGPVVAAETDTYDLKPDLVVTPSRRIETLDDALASVSVITREDIEVSAAQGLAELLRLLPGVDVVRSGGPGSQVSVFLRGSNSNHVLVLIDGVRASSSNTGAYVWEQLPVNQVERVEVVRGPRASIYGSDSMGGVIHVITRGDPAPYARLTLGSYGTGAFEGGLGSQGERGRFSLNAGYRNVDGFSAQNPNGFSYDPDDDGFETANIGLKGRTRLGSGTLRFSLLALANETEFDQGLSETDQKIASLAYDGSISKRWEYQLITGHVSEELGSDFGFFETGFDSERTQFSWQNQYATANDHRLSFGLDWYSEQGRSLGSWNESRRNTGLFADWDHDAGSLHSQLNVRWDDNSEFGSEMTGQAAFSWAMSEHWSARASYGSAFRGPNLNEQYSPGFGGLFAGNPDLDPESSRTAEVGLNWRPSNRSALSVSAYRTEAKDLIAFTGEEFRAINIDEARLKGLEFDYRISSTDWDFGFNATLQDNKDLVTGNALLRRPDRKASMTVDRRFGDGSWLGIEWIYIGDRLDFGSIRLDSYQLVNLRGGWRFHPAWQAEIRGENLADEPYDPAWGFNAAGRSWFLSLAWIP